jgi:hypothetical protein
VRQARLDQILAIIGGGHIGAHRQGSLAELFDFADDVDRRVDALGVVHDDIVTTLGEGDRDRPANAARGTGDQGDGEVTHGMLNLQVQNPYCTS